MILASGSPQRKAILEQLGLEFTIVVPDVEELTEGDPEQLAVENARRKASSVASGQRATGNGQIVMGVDTVVVVDGRAYGKPGGREEADTMLRMLAGREHEVFSGICLVEDGRAQTGLERTRVRFRPLDEDVHAWYLASEEWRGRAGGYAIQGRGAALVAAIDGDYLNVVGLPVGLLQDLAPHLLTQA